MSTSDMFIRACMRSPITHVPVWYMRQAGRYQPEYREIRKKYSLLDICRHPEVCYEVTKLPVDYLGVDAAILFSDIMVPIGPMGMAFDIKEGIGPVIESPIRTPADIDRLHVFDPAAELPHVLDTIRLLKRDLTVPLIGFTGAPFTLASYMVEGGPSRSYIKTKQFMWSEPAQWQRLMDKLADMIVVYLTAQVQSGAAAVQVFDSWVGSLAPRDYKTYVWPAMKRIFNALKPLGVPLIYSGVGTGELLTLMGETGANVVSVDWRVPLSSARERLPEAVALQGNLDPIMLFGPWSELEARTREIIDEGLAAGGFIFNLGQGVVHHNPPIEPETLRRLTAFVHEYSRDRLAALQK